MITTILAAAGVGLASSFHCAAMCGPLVLASCTERSHLRTYAVARLVGYAFVGALGSAIAAPLIGNRWVRVAAALLAMFILLRAGLRLVRTERAPKLVQLTRKRRIRPALLGVMTSFFPCGALLSGLIIASGSGSALGGALSMASFALASTPGLIGAIVGATAIALRFAHARRLAGVAMFGMALLVAFQATSFLRPKPHACCPNQ